MYCLRFAQKKTWIENPQNREKQNCRRLPVPNKFSTRNSSINPILNTATLIEKEKEKRKRLTTSEYTPTHEHLSLNAYLAFHSIPTLQKNSHAYIRPEIARFGIDRFRIEQQNERTVRAKFAADGTE
jgi:hypothetical protein